MSGKNIITAAVAGIIVFAWSMFSWMVLPFHKGSIDTLNAEAIAVAAVKQAAPDSGMYAYPNMEAEDKSATPRLLVAINYKEKVMPICMAIAILINVLGALAVCCLICKSGVTDFGTRMKLVFGATLFAAIVGHLPNWLYWGFTPMYTVLAIVDLFIAWGLAGFWIAKRV